MEPMRLPDGGSSDVPSNEDLAQRATQPRNAISGDEVGILDPVCKSDGFAEGSVARGRFSECGDRPKPPATDGRTHRAGVGSGAPTQSVRGLGTGVGTTASTRWSDYGGYRRRLRSRGAQAGMVRSDRGQKRRRFSAGG